MSTDTSNEAGLGKRIVYGLVVALLLSSVSGAAMVNGVDRTALDSKYVADTLESENVYAGITDEYRTNIVENVSRAVNQDLPAGVEVVNFDPRRAANETITQEYVSSQMRGVITDLYAYVRDETDELMLPIDLEPVRENLRGVFGTEQIFVEVETLIKELVGTVEAGSVTVSGEDIASFSESEERYQRTRTQIRVDIVFSVFRAEQPDALLASVIDGYDPREYSEQERQTEIDTREDAIREVLRTRVRDSDQLPEQVRTAFETAEEQIRDRIRSETQTVPRADQLSGPAEQLGMTVVDGLVGEVNYREYQSQLEQNEQALEAAIVSAIDSEIQSTGPENVDFAENITSQQQNTLDTATQAIRVISFLWWLLPVLTLLLVGVLYALTRDGHQTGSTTGKSFIFAGLVGVLVGFVLNPVVQDVIQRRVIDGQQNDAAAVADAVLAVVDGTLRQMGLFFAVVLMIGVVLFQLVAIDRRGTLDPLREALGHEPHDSTTRGADQTAKPGPDSSDTGQAVGDPSIEAEQTPDETEAAPGQSQANEPDPEADITKRHPAKAEDHNNRDGDDVTSGDAADETGFLNDNRSDGTDTSEQSGSDNES